MANKYTVLRKQLRIVRGFLYGELDSLDDKAYVRYVSLIKEIEDVVDGPMFENDAEMVPAGSLLSIVHERRSNVLT